MNPYFSSLCGTAIVMVLSLLSALLVFPLLEKPFTKHILSLLSMLAVGCLGGDAIFHLIPHAMKLNDRKASSGSTLYNSTKSVLNNSTVNIQNGDNGDVDIMWKGVVIMISLYFFYILNTITHFLKIPHAHSHGHSHSHTLHTTLHPMHKAETNDENSTATKTRSPSSDEKPLEQNKKTIHLTPDQRNDADWISEKCILLQEQRRRSSASDYAALNLNLESKLPPPLEASKKLPNIVWMVLLGDVIHNLTDGIAVGASFAGSFSGGISTSIAVLCHEIPHEIGDFVIMINAGIEPFKALWLTATTYASALVGTIFGVAMGEELNIVEWIFAITAGMFLYIALVELLPDSIDDVEDDNERNWTSYLCQNVGLIIGTATMALIAAYEDSMKNFFVL